MPLHRLHLNAAALPPHTRTLLPLIPSPTQKKITSFHFPADRNLSLGSALLQRYIVHTLHPSHPPLSSITLSADPETSRPFYPDGAQIGLADYNTSHHNPREAPDGERQPVALVARTGEKGRVGVDVVPTTQARPGGFLGTFTDPGSQVLSAKEIAWVKTLGGEKAQVRGVLMLWGLKEAYAKALGQGLGIRLDTVEFEMREVIREGRDTGAKCWVEGKEVTGEWVFEVEFLQGEKQEEGEGFYLMIAADRDGLEDTGGEWREVSVSELLAAAGMEGR